ncbi:hypothetical protein V5O48_015287 [Marasmius crinis-equi]|uniref:Uncharacterized protein n=1 Tax=Marasmius crinis-equi TaxID=585013 RepID=A0ABR3EV93_9AGAR
MLTIKWDREARPVLPTHKYSIRELEGRKKEEEKGKDEHLTPQEKRKYLPAPLSASHHPTPNQELAIKTRKHINPQHRKPLLDLIIPIPKEPRHNSRIHQIQDDEAAPPEEHGDTTEAIEELDGDHVHDEADGAVDGCEEEGGLGGDAEGFVENCLVVVCGGG